MIDFKSAPSTGADHKEGFITILPVVSANTNDSYTYSFESSTLEDDFLVIDNKLVSDWDFNVSANPNWEVVDGISSEGNSSIMMNGKKLTSANPIVFETQSYNLSDLTEPAISIDYIGAAVNSFPTNTLKVYYSEECGVWKELTTIGASQLASAGYYSENFPKEEEKDNLDWNTIVMFDEVGSNDLKADNVRFKFEYNVSSIVNRLYIDNIRIGEAADLELTTSNTSRVGLSVYPNPTTEKSNVLFTLDKNSDIEIKLFNILGSEVTLLKYDGLISGPQSIEIDLSNIERGVYFVSVLTEGTVLETTKLIID